MNKLHKVCIKKNRPLSENLLTVKIVIILITFILLIKALKVFLTKSKVLIFLLR